MREGKHCAILPSTGISMAMTCFSNGHLKLARLPQAPTQTPLMACHTESPPRCANAEKIHNHLRPFSLSGNGSTFNPINP